MAQFVKVTFKIDGGNHLKKWIPVNKIVEMSQNSDVQWPNDEGTILFTDGYTIQVIGFNETIESLMK